MQKGARGPVQRILLVATVWQILANARSVQPVHAVELPDTRKDSTWYVSV